MTDAPRTCSVVDCERVYFCKGYCRMHFERWCRHGDPAVVLKVMSARGAPLAWLHQHAAHIGDDCLIWPFARFPDGRAHMRQGRPARIMCKLVHGPAPSTAHQAAHSCGRAQDACVNPRHLRWATPKENAGDKVQHGTLLSGESLPQHKLTAEDVIAIRTDGGATPAKVLAARYGVRPPAIYKVRNRERWQHIP